MGKEHYWYFECLLGERKGWRIVYVDYENIYRQISHKKTTYM